jgi:plasmid stabilization system protein ParE
VKRYSVRWASVASDDLTRIIDYIAAESPLNALKVADRIEALARSLEHFPKRGHAVPELAQQGIQAWLELNAAPWRLIHRIEGRRVEVAGRARRSS